MTQRRAYYNYSEANKKGNNKHKNSAPPTTKADTVPDKVDNIGPTNNSPPKVNDNLKDDTTKNPLRTEHDDSLVKALVEHSRAPSPFEYSEKPPT